MEDDARLEREASDRRERRPYEKPQLIQHGTIGELTQSGGNRQRDAIFTRALS